MLNTLLLIGGLALILAGANGLTDGSAAVAKRFRISDLVIGLTIVAFGTSAPELVISVLHPPHKMRSSLLSGNLHSPPLSRIRELRRAIWFCRSGYPI